MWCHADTADIKINKVKKSRELSDLDTMLEKFRSECGGDLKKAMDCKNVIDERYFDIPLNQVSELLV